MVDYKNENERDNRRLKNKKKLKIIKVIIVKIYLGISLELLWAVWGQFSVR